MSVLRNISKLFLTARVSNFMSLGINSFQLKDTRRGVEPKDLAVVNGADAHVDLFINNIVINDQLKKGTKTHPSNFCSPRSKLEFTNLSIKGVVGHIYGALTHVDSLSQQGHIAHVVNLDKGEI